MGIRDTIKDSSFTHPHYGSEQLPTNIKTNPWDLDDEQFDKDFEGIFQYTCRPGMIDGLLKVPLKWNVDDRGMLMEVLRANDPHYQSAFDPLNNHEGNFGQNYVVIDPMPGTVRAFHAHNCLFDFFTIINGSAKFIFYDDQSGERDRPRSKTYGNLEVVVTGKENPMCIVVRPEIFHGWISLEPNTILLSTGTHCYQEVCKIHGAPDETRIPWDTFGEKIWETTKK